MVSSVKPGPQYDPSRLTLPAGHTWHLVSVYTTTSPSIAHSKHSSDGSDIGRDDAEVPASIVVLFACSDDCNRLIQVEPLLWIIVATWKVNEAGADESGGNGTTVGSLQV